MTSRLIAVEEALRRSLSFPFPYKWYKYGDNPATPVAIRFFPAIRNGNSARYGQYNAGNVVNSAVIFEMPRVAFRRREQSIRSLRTGLSVRIGGETLVHGKPASAPTNFGQHATNAGAFANPDRASRR